MRSKYLSALRISAGRRRQPRRSRRRRSGPKTRPTLRASRSLLFLFVQQPEVATESPKAPMTPQQTAGQPVDGGDAHPAQIAPVAGPGRAGGSVETGAHFPGRRAVVGADQQFSGIYHTQEQQVYRSQYDGQGLARSRAGDAQQGPIPVADQVQLLVIEFRVQAAYGGCDGVERFHDYLLQRRFTELRGWVVLTAARRKTRRCDDSSAAGQTGRGRICGLPE